MAITLLFLTQIAIFIAIPNNKTRKITRLGVAITGMAAIMLLMVRLWPVCLQALITPIRILAAAATAATRRHNTELR